MKQQKGFTLLATVFILVVLALGGVYLLKLSFSHVQTINYTLLKSRAALATLSAFELLNAINDEKELSCQEYRYQFDKSANALNGFTVQLSCTQSISYPSSNPTFTAFQFKAITTYGQFGDRDYVQDQQSHWFINPKRSV